MLTSKEAKALGFTVVRGDYIGTADNRADRWYIDKLDDPVIDRRGEGFATKEDALRYLTSRLKSCREE